MAKLAGKIAWVTGAGSGIGEAAAIALAQEGATIVLTGRRKEPLEHVARRIHQFGGIAHVQPADLMHATQVQKVGAFIKDTLGRLDILVNNAGLNILKRHWSDLTPEGIDEVVHGNLSSAALLRHRRPADDARPERRRDDHTASWRPLMVASH